jgi:hypothetical protein
VRGRSGRKTRGLYYTIKIIWSSLINELLSTILQSNENPYIESTHNKFACLNIEKKNITKETHRLSKTVPKMSEEICILMQLSADSYFTELYDCEHYKISAKFSYLVIWYKVFVSVCVDKLLVNRVCLWKRINRASGDADATYLHGNEATTCCMLVHIGYIYQEVLVHVTSDTSLYSQNGSLHCYVSFWM